MLGHPLYLDGLTDRKDRLNYERCFVENRMEYEFKSEVIFTCGERTHVQPVMYEWKSERCKKWNIFGHEEESYSPSHFLQLPNSIPKTVAPKKASQTVYREKAKKKN